MLPRRTWRTTGVERGLLAVSCSLSLAACGAVDAPGSGSSAGADEAGPRAYQASLLEQCAVAWAARDLERVEALLALPRAGATPEQERRFETFDELTATLRVERTGFVRRAIVLAQRSSLDAAPASGGGAYDLEFGEPLALELVLEPAERHACRVLARGEGGSSRLQVAVRVADIALDGSRTMHERPRVLRLEKPLVLENKKPLVLPLPRVADPWPGVCVREIRVSAELRPAGFVWDGRRLPLTRLVFEPLSVHRFPKGFRSLRRAPLRTLVLAARRPLRRLRHILVASWFLSRDAGEAERERGLGVLVELCRDARPGTERTLLFCLELLAGDDAPGGRDREAWLRWWALRSRR